MNKLQSKKRGAQEIAGYFTVFLSVAIIGLIFWLTLDALVGGDDPILEVNSTGYNATMNVQEGMENATDFLPKIGKIVGVAALVGVLFLLWYYAKKSKMTP